MRVLNRLLATVLALGLLFGGVLAALDIVLVHLRRRAWLVPVDQWARWLRRTTYEAGVVRAVSIGLIVLGLLLLIAALRRGRPGALALPSSAEGVRVTASRRGLEHALAAAVRRVDGVRAARVKARRRSLRVRADTSLRDPGDLQQRIDGVVGERLAVLGLDGALRPRVTVSGKGSR